VDLRLKCASQSMQTPWASRIGPATLPPMEFRPTSDGRFSDPLRECAAPMEFRPTSGAGLCPSDTAADVNIFSAGVATTADRDVFPVSAAVAATAARGHHAATAAACETGLITAGSQNSTDAASTAAPSANTARGGTPTSTARPSADTAGSLYEMACGRPAEVNEFFGT